MVFKTKRDKKKYRTGIGGMDGKHKIYVQMRNDWMLYLMILPVIAWYIIFCYGPMAGLILAF